MLYPLRSPILNWIPIGVLLLIRKKGAGMSKSIMTLASSVAPSFTSNYSFNTTNPKWAAKRAYAHFGNGAYGVNG